MNPNVICGMVAFLLLSQALGSATNMTLRLIAPEVNGWFRFTSDGYVEAYSSTERIYKVEASANLSNWTEIAVLHRQPTWSADYFTGQRHIVTSNLFYTDPGSGLLGRRSYRVRAVEPQALDWKNQIRQPQDAFSSGVQFVSWIKFVISTNEPTRVYFADSAAYDLHYHFVTNRIPGFANLSREEVDRRSQYNTNRQLYLGTVIQPWEGGWPLREYGIQLVGRDPIPPEKVRELFDIVRSAVMTQPGVPVTYVPTFEQMSSVEANRSFFETNGIPLRRSEDWIRTDTCYSLGWALGRLVFVSAANVPAAYANGTLRPTDILLTDGVPAELPYVAGIITLAAATPNSHVAILAQSYKVPFLYVADQSTRERLLSYVNREVVLQLTPEYDWQQLGSCRTVLVGLDPDLDPALKAELLALKQPPPLNIRRKQRFGAYVSPTADLTPDDARFFGGKAANFGLLRRILPTNSPTPSVAISMDLWDDFMDQTMSSGLTLRAEISNRLSRFIYPPDVAAVKAELNTIRSRIRNQAQFTASQQQTILAALAPFATNRNIRFRSSSNVEDADYFSGAGLYDSFSGCSADDLTGNTGPSICDPSEDGPRGVFRAIRRVYASFYNDNAFLERLRLNINETEVGMGLLVHYSAPDDIEMANGVATLSGGTAKLVSQVGAVSVTNPDGNSIPEEVQAWDGHIQLTRSSSLLLLGEHVLTWPSDYHDLARMLFLVSDAYVAANSRPGAVLDFEYKKIQPGVLEIKQVREVPSTLNTQQIAPYLLNDRQVFATVQDLYSGSLAELHRLKARWTCQTRNMPFTLSNLHGGFLTEATVEWINGDRVVTNTLASFSNLVYRLDESRPGGGPPAAIYSWRMNFPAGAANYSLTVFEGDPWLVSPQENPILSLAEFRFKLRAEYDHPVRLLISDAWETHSVPTTNESVHLGPLQTNSLAEVPKVLNFDQAGSGPTNVTVTSRYYLGNNHLYAGEPPLFRFEETRITGLTSQSIVLRGFFSQTWSGWHRQEEGEEFLFEPHLEEGIDPAILQELEAKNIRLIYLYVANRNTLRTNEMITFSSHAADDLP